MITSLQAYICFDMKKVYVHLDTKKAHLLLAREERPRIWRRRPSMTRRSHLYEREGAAVPAGKE
jgi:hypothetical protein